MFGQRCKVLDKKLCSFRKKPWHVLSLRPTALHILNHCQTVHSQINPNWDIPVWKSQLFSFFPSVKIAFIFNKLSKKTQRTECVLHLLLSNGSLTNNYQTFCWEKRNQKKTISIDVCIYFTLNIENRWSKVFDLVIVHCSFSGCQSSCQLCCLLMLISILTIKKSYQKVKESCLKARLDVTQNFQVIT